MAETQNTTSPGPIIFSSCLKEDRWHNQSGCKSFERWHFDALSDDGREALVIKFYDNYVFSPRYFQQSGNHNGHPITHEKRCPAISFAYSLDGKIILQATNEFRAGEFSASDNGVNCSIGASSFRIDAASYGSGFMIKIDLMTARKCVIKAELEWLSIESDLSEAPAETDTALWNMVAPRSDVSGRIELIGHRGKPRRLVQFRGTGYHDHIRSGDFPEGTIGTRYWGRAHFIDSTVIFHHHETTGTESTYSKLFLIRDGAIHERDVSGLEKTYRRNRYGLKIPQRISFLSSDNIRLRVKPFGAIQSGFFESKMRCEITLMLRDGKPRKTIGIAEHVSPARMRSQVLRWISDMRIGKSGKGPLF